MRVVYCDNLVPSEEKWLSFEGHQNYIQGYLSLPGASTSLMQHAQGPAVTFTGNSGLSILDTRNVIVVKKKKNV